MITKYKSQANATYESVLKSYGSGIYVEVGEEMSLENLLYGLMLRSGNELAITE